MHMTLSTSRDLLFPIYRPFLDEQEKKYVDECLSSTWISSKGRFIPLFEKQFADYVGVEFATSVCNGTVALHLALMVLGIQPGDEVIVPTLTYIASINTIVQAGAKPVFVDSLESTWQMDPADITRKITARTKAIMAVHLYGQPCDMKAIVAICQKHSLLLIEDCAEAFGSYFDGKHVGTFGDIATFSFFGNKTITTGEGGMLTSKHANVHELAYRLKTQGVSPEKTYWHEIAGFNYRMTNICAAIGLAQLEKADKILAKKRQIAAWYNQHLNDLPLVTHQEAENTKNSYWMYSILLTQSQTRDHLGSFLLENGIETRPFFYPAHHMPMYIKEGKDLPVAENLSLRGMNLPSFPALSKQDVGQISQKIRDFFHS